MAPRMEAAESRVRAAALLLTAGRTAGAVGTHAYWMLAREAARAERGGPLPHPPPPRRGAPPAPKLRTPVDVRFRQPRSRPPAGAGLRYRAIRACATPGRSG